MTEETKKKRSSIGVILWGLIGVGGLIYLLNPGAGVLEIIPDNLPIVGNLDEATATYLVLSALKYMTGFDLMPGRKRLAASEPTDKGEE